MSLLSSIFDTGLYTVTRTNGQGTTDDGGHYYPPSTTVIPNVIGSLQPLSGRALRDLKEGKRADDMREFFTETPMYTVDEKHDQQDFLDAPDEVDPTVMRRYRVTAVKFHGVISGHYRVTLEKVTVP